MLTNSLIFRITADAYGQVLRFQQEIDHAVLCYQIETRGQALVVRLGSKTGLRKISELPQPGAAEPYYGTLGGAYRFTFHPMVGGCELELTNQMGGFAFFYPQRFDPLRMYLFNPPEETCISDFDAPDAVLEASMGSLHQWDSVNQIIQFRIPPLLYKTFNDWPWSHRPLYAYDFTFIPTSSGCLSRVTARESGVVLELTGEEAL
jgi:hypothetical protein